MVSAMTQMCRRPPIGLASLIVLNLLTAAWPQTAAPSSGPDRVEIHLDETGPRDIPWPITTGVPFPRGKLVDESNCRLMDDMGRECALQSKVAATWDAQRSSIRWLTIDFIAAPGRRYFLEFGPHISRKLPLAAHDDQRSPIQIDATGPAERAERLRVATGPLQVTFSQNGGSGLESIACDLNGDGRFAADETVAHGPADGEHYYIDQTGRRFTSALVPSSAASPTSGANQPLAESAAPTRHITLETRGPVRTTIRVDGSYASPGQPTIVNYRTRYHVFAGLSMIKVVDEFRIVGSTRDTQFHDIAFALTLAPQHGSRHVVTDDRSTSISPVPGPDEFRVASPAARLVRIPWLPGTERVSSYQAQYRHVGNSAYEAAVVAVGAGGEQRHAQADRAAAWLQTTDARFAATGSLRWFWQQFPKEWEATNEQLVLHLWSPRGGALDFNAAGIRRFFGEAGDRYVLNWFGLRGTPTALSDFFYFACREFLENNTADAAGIRKHHEFTLHFAPAARAHEGVHVGRLTETPPLGLASGDWNCGTDVFGPLVARPPQQGSATNQPTSMPPGPPSTGAPTGATDSPRRFQESNSPVVPPEARPLVSRPITAQVASDYRRKGEAVVDRIFQLGRYGQDTFGDYGFWLFGAGPHYSYQWDPVAKRHYADPRRFDFHTYQKETQLWWCYLRSGDRKFWEWCLPSENHWTDVAVAHVPLQFESDWQGGDRAPARRTLHFRPGDWAIDSPVHYLRHHNTAEAWLRGGSQFWASYHRTLETTTLAYYLTGDERFQEVIEYWREYFGPLAGQNSRSTDFRPWHQEQAWYDTGATVTIDGVTRPKTWAEMIRDYAPFASGSRHQMTLWFNLSTLYEHTWDPKIGQTLREYADAFLNPPGMSGVWHSQENDLPAHAPTPTMAHFWSPALWKYHRATGDPRLPDILSRYFTACYLSDPFGLSQDIGVYSNQHHGYGYYFTRDPRHVRQALRELDKLAPHAEPLAKPEDLNRRIYNPYATIECLAGVPRLVWATEQAQHDGIAIPPPPPLKPQRTLLAFHKSAGKPLSLELWGFDQRVTLLDPGGAEVMGLQVQTSQHHSPVQPVDRVLPKFEAYLHQVTIPADAPAGWYLLAPHLELGVLSTTSSLPPLCLAVRAVQLAAGESCWVHVAATDDSLVIQSANLRDLAIALRDGSQPPTETVTAGGRSVLRVSLSSQNAAGNDARKNEDGNVASPQTLIRPVKITNTRLRPAWFAIDGSQAVSAWVSFTHEPLSAELARANPGSKATTAALQRLAPVPRFDPDQEFVAGRFGQAALIVPGRKIILPDRAVSSDSTGPDGSAERQLFNLRQGTLEFFVKKLWDERLTAVRSGPFITNGLLSGYSPWSLPVNEWAHVAVVWRPFKRDPSQICVHVYVDGLDRAYYRSTWWEGYSNRPQALPRNGRWLEGLICQAMDGGAFALDEIRLSTTARYADTEIEFGNRQTFNPVRFEAPRKPLPVDEHTSLLFRFDGNLQAEATAVPGKIQGRFSP